MGKISQMENEENITAAATKLCYIIKRANFDGYGFNLHSEKSKPGQFIGKVDTNSPAEMAGLKEGDRIIQVNGVSIHNETHKQVVQRIKAIANEVRLLLIDADGKGDAVTDHKDGLAGSTMPPINGQPQYENNSNRCSTASAATSIVLPGVSENINSITIVSSKRNSSMDNSQAPNNNMHNNNNNNNNQHSNNNNNNNKNDDDDDENTKANQMEMMTNIPPPPSATMAASAAAFNKTPTTADRLSDGGLQATLAASNANGSTTTTTTMESNSNRISSSSSGGSGSGGNSNGISTTNSTANLRAGVLQLPMTAAEMRAKLMSRKKYDPKNESVDLKKKYEIVQKL